MRIFVSLVCVLSLGAGTAAAQWLSYPSAGIPRTADGKPNLSAPAPRLPDGKPDVSGIWLANSPKYLQNLAADLKPGDVVFLPTAEALFKERQNDARAKEESDANCLPQGVPKINATPVPFKIVQNPGLVIILYEAFDLYRQIFIDGRALPQDPNPTWLGYSVGRYDGNALVVDTTGFNARTWLDQKGHPQTGTTRVTERFVRRDFGHMDIQITIDDPKAYAKPWTATEPMHLLPDTEILEFVCNENEKDVKHLSVK
jgi:hypothetical protein